MATDAAMRAQYLAALGIDAWVPRHAPLADPVPVPVANSAAPLRAEALDWVGLRAAVAGCQACGLAATRKNTVFGVGDQQARWMVIGEAPGADEDERGEPFVGAAGQLLDKMLLAIDLPRASVFIANMLKCRPPGNRDPQPQELASCRSYLLRQVALVQPSLVLVVGRVAAQNLLQTTQSLAQLRGKVHRAPDFNTPLIVTYHPAYLLRTPADKRKAWDDLKFARQTFAQLTAAPE